MLPNVIKIKPQGTETEMQLRGYIRCRGTSSNNHTQKKAQTMLNTVFCAFSLVRMLAFWYVKLFFCENVLYVCNSATGARARVVTHRILDAALLHAPLFVPLSSSYDKHFYTLDV